LGVRVRVKIATCGRVVESTALVNTGFEADEPQILVPHYLLVENNIDIGRLGKPVVLEYDTAGGPTSMYVYPKACRVSVVEPDRVSREVEADLVLSLVEREVLLSDALTEELGIIILSPRKGLWRFIDDPLDVTRSSRTRA